jgi:hypothetical protein
VVLLLQRNFLYSCFRRVAFCCDVRYTFLTNYKQFTLDNKREVVPSQIKERVIELVDVLVQLDNLKDMKVRLPRVLTPTHTTRPPSHAHLCRRTDSLTHAHSIPFHSARLIVRPDGTRTLTHACTLTRSHTLTRTRINTHTHAHAFHTSIRAGVHLERLLLVQAVPEGHRGQHGAGEDGGVRPRSRVSPVQRVVTEL